MRVDGSFANTILYIYKSMCCELIWGENKLDTCMASRQEKGLRYIYGDIDSALREITTEGSLSGGVDVWCGFIWAF